jgi:hypothetical protein
VADALACLTCTRLLRKVAALACEANVSLRVSSDGLAWKEARVIQQLVGRRLAVSGVASRIQAP